MWITATSIGPSSSIRADIFELARFWTSELGRAIVVVTNQSGIGRGPFGENAYADLTRWMCGRFAAEGAAIARVYCPYHPRHGVGAYRCDHPWRKLIRE
jgi:D-glycero-D-manno-heptose 1,7-bisphosphate phosphatase